ncbi:MAG: peptidoglycan-binding protein [Okeania sp. SIO3H1]|uniref:peptidoglycan-binding domain-containing protein n=1 Tax=Okeania sp. SIO1I7 TaxID=2607772 RepID=UPI0013C81294|nr:peptidoglycan-binding protein [Okeania sp. SIO1I7]NEN89261.1 peptidoglycan-binding protein [Okeania sp. SIO3H1]NET28011.1 peptidoglycan-binding protein [Okeania sp. SIO1I7]
MWAQIPLEINSVPISINRPILKTGSQGEEVSQLQGVLKLMGYYLGKVNGIYSDSTAAAVVKFQEDVGLIPNGIVDQNTWNRLLPATPTSNNVTETTLKDTDSSCECAKNQTSATTTTNQSPGTINSEVEISSSIDLPTLKIGMRGNAVRGLQQRLKAKGFLKGKIDGIFGLQTQTAVKMAQRKYRQQQDGIVDTPLWIALLR